MPNGPCIMAETAGATTPGTGADNRWFQEQVQPHESLLRRWLHARFPSLADMDDVIQDAYARLFRAHQLGKVKSAKNYLFATARNAAVDRVRHNGVIPMESLEDNAEVDVLQSETGVVEAVSRDQELQILRDAMTSLPTRCRQVFTLRKLYGLPHAEIARQLGISPKTVDVQINKAMRLCAAYLRARGLP